MARKNLNEMDFTLYWFMFPVAIGVATVAMLSGIAGAALFMPIFLLLFPFLCKEYVLAHPIVSIAAALLTSTFGFASGYLGYSRRGLIDYRMAAPFLIYALPFALLGAWICTYFAAELIRFAYGLMMVILALFFFKGTRELAPSTLSGNRKSGITIQTREGQKYTYRRYRPSLVPTAIGGFFTGLLSTGIGEITMPQLVTKGKIPVPVAAATSVMVVICTFFVAATAHIFTLIREGGWEAVPWNLVCYTIPGVIIGGQVGPRLQGRYSRKNMIKGIAAVFVLVVIDMCWTVLREIK